ncbi:MAG TPA: hypothetical protein VNQ73_16065 [Ilumatobacter sp.]|nr:hypothetical protein [Ilumatobacter sp.]
MARSPHLPQIIQGPLAARPSAASTPDWVWYFAWDDGGGAFHRATPDGWVRATPPAAPDPWEQPVLENGWAPADPPIEVRRNGHAVELRGGVSRSSGPLPSVVTTLPEGLRPAGQAWFPVVVADGLASVSVDTDGTVTALAAFTGGAADPNGLITFDAVRFPL